MSQCHCLCQTQWQIVPNCTGNASSWHCHDRMRAIMRHHNAIIFMSRMTVTSVVPISKVILLNH